VDENPVGERPPLGRPRFGWEDVIGKDVEALNGGPDWITRAFDGEGWRIGCVTGRHKWPTNPKQQKTRTTCSSHSASCVVSGDLSRNI